AQPTTVASKTMAAATTATAAAGSRRVDLFPVPPLRSWPPAWDWVPLDFITNHMKLAIFCRSGRNGCGGAGGDPGAIARETALPGPRARTASTGAPCPEFPCQLNWSDRINRCAELCP